MSSAPDARLGVDDHFVEDDLHGSRRARDHTDVPRLDGACAEQTALGVGAADHHGGALAQSEVRGRRRGERAQPAPALADFGKERSRQLEAVDPLPRPLARRHVEEQAPDGLARLAGNLPAQQVAHPIAEAQEVRSAAEAVRAGLLQPAQAGRPEDREGPMPRELLKRVAVLGGELQTGTHGARIAIRHRQQHVAGRVEEDGPQPHARARDGGHLVGTRTRASHGLPGRRGQRGAGRGKIQIEPESASSGCRRRRDGSCRRGDPLGCEVEDQAADAPAAQIESNRVLAHRSSVSLNPLSRNGRAARAGSGTPCP